VTQYIKIIEKIQPFNYLTQEELEDLMAHEDPMKGEKGEVLLKEGERKDWDKMFLLLQGSVSVWMEDKKVGYIVAPSYFGERAVFLEKSRKATIMATTQVVYLKISASLIFSLLKRNPYFCSAFAFALREKQKIFSHFNSYLSLLMTLKANRVFAINEIISAYESLSPILHRGCHQKNIDFNALYYAVSRLPDNLTSMHLLVLSEDILSFYKIVEKHIKLDAEKGKKVNFFEVLPGKVLILLRDEVSHYADILSKYCVYVIEVRKIIERLNETPEVLEKLAQHYFNPLSEAREKKLLTLLPFSKEELEELKKIFKKDLLRKLYEIMAQNSNIQVNVVKTIVRYHHVGIELWTNQIKWLVKKHISKNFFEEEIDVHIISSNIHSVPNCLSMWVHGVAKNKLDLKSYDFLEDENDKVYAATKHLLEKDPSLEEEKLKVEEKNGLYRLAENYFTGVNVTLIDPSKVGSQVDSHLVKLDSSRRKIIFNIDYAYGKQAEQIIFNLILLFGKKIKSLSVFGKAGAILGKRGDILIPHYFMMQGDDSVHSFENDIQRKELMHEEKLREIHEGPMLTVLGPLIQSHEMLMFYMNFWHVIGMEMEGAHFIRVINRLKPQGLLSPQLQLRFLYYVSDVPLSPAETLAKRLSIEEGLSVVYALTRIFLNKIFKEKK